MLSRGAERLEGRRTVSSAKLVGTYRGARRLRGRHETKKRGAILTERRRVIENAMWSRGAERPEGRRTVEGCTVDRDIRARDGQEGAVRQ